MNENKGRMPTKIELTLEQSQQGVSDDVLRSKEDHVVHISKSIFVTNFPDNFGSSDLWKVCEGYGKVVDVYIPNRMSKAGKRFTFVRFIRVEDIDRLIGNLCTIWIGRFHLHANVVRFERASKHVKPSGYTPSNVHGKSGSYAKAVRGNFPLNVPATPASFTPALVLDDACAIIRDFSHHVMGKVKDINSIPNLQTLLSKEGFPKVKLSFLGVLWDVPHDFVSEECVVWVDIEGVPLNVWSLEMFMKIDNKWGEALDIEDNSGSSFTHKRLCILTKQPDTILEKFKVIFKGKVFMVRAKELFTWNPIFLELKELVYTLDDESVQGAKNQSVGLQHSDEISDDDSDVDGVPDTVFGKNSSSQHTPCSETGKQQSDDPFVKMISVLKMLPPMELIRSPVRNRGSILDVLEDMVRVGHSMGYKLEGCMKDIERIIGSQGVDDVLK
ncbi:RNA-directed DNA polymerase, eukaryota [Tanacetum coccineum]|uniref:RNA-directed DNA polymerase, eukaryota n=1 Tax=Tanacetum coccineum TaxID=301880 RepID=A0ABQ5AJW6_9ASTR